MLRENVIDLDFLICMAICLYLILFKDTTTNTIEWYKMRETPYMYRAKVEEGWIYTSPQGTWIVREEILPYVYE